MKKYLSLLFLTSMALYCPEGEVYLGDVLSGSDRTAYDALDRIPYDELTDMQAEELLELQIKAYELKQQKAVSNGNSDANAQIVALQNKQDQLMAEKKLLEKHPSELTDEDIAAMLQYPEGSPIYERALEVKNERNLNLGTHPIDPSGVTQVIDPLAQIDQRALDYALQLDTLLKQYDAIIQGIATKVPQQDIAMLDYFFRKAAALAKGMQAAVRGLDSYVNGKDGETYRQMLDRARVSGDPTFEEKAQRTLAQVDTVLNVIRIMAFNDVSQMALKLATPSLDLKNFRNIVSAMCGLTETGEPNQNIDFGTTVLAKDFRNFGIEIFNNAENIKELNTVLVEWGSKIIQDLYVSMEVLQSNKNGSDIFQVASVLRPILESQISTTMDNITKNLPLEEDGELAHALYLWKAKQKLDPMFAIYGWVSGADQKILEDQNFIQGLNPDIDAAMKSYFLNGKSSLVQSLYDGLVSLVNHVQQADTLSIEQIIAQRDDLFAQSHITPKVLKDALLSLKDLTDYELSEIGRNFWNSDSVDPLGQFSAEEDRENYLTRLQQTQVLQNAIDAMQKLSVAMLARPESRALIGKADKEINELLIGKSGSGQLLSKEEQIKEFTKKIEKWQELSNYYNEHFSGLPDSILSGNANIELLRSTLGDFDSSLEKARTVIAQALQVQHVTMGSSKNDALEALKKVSDTLASLVGKDSNLQQIAKPLSDQMINLKVDIFNINSETTLKQLLVEYGAETDLGKKQELKEKIKQVYEDQNALYRALYDAKQTFESVVDAVQGYNAINKTIIQEDFPLLQVPVIDPKASGYSASEVAQFGSNVMDSLNPAKLLNNKEALAALGKKLLCAEDSSWQKIEDNFALDDYDALVAQRNFDVLGLHADMIDWSNITPSILQEVATIWLKPLVNKDPKFLTVKELQLINQSLYESAVQAGDVASKEATMHKTLSDIVSSQVALDAFLYTCGLGGRDVSTSKNEDAVQDIIKQIPDMQMVDDYKAWLDLVIGNDRKKAQLIIQGS